MNSTLFLLKILQLKAIQKAPDQNHFVVTKGSQAVLEHVSSTPEHVDEQREKLLSDGALKT